MKRTVLCRALHPTRGLLCGKQRGHIHFPGQARDHRTTAPDGSPDDVTWPPTDAELAADHGPTIAIETRDGRMSARAFSPMDRPLVITQVAPAAVYAVTHVKTGYKVVACDALAHTREALKAIADLDWASIDTAVFGPAVKAIGVAMRERLLAAGFVHQAEGNLWKKVRKSPPRKVPV